MEYTLDLFLRSAAQGLRGCGGNGFRLGDQGLHARVGDLRPVQKHLIEGGHRPDAGEPAVVDQGERQDKIFDWDWRRLIGPAFSPRDARRAAPTNL